MDRLNKYRQKWNKEAPVKPEKPLSLNEIKRRELFKQWLEGLSDSDRNEYNSLTKRNKQLKDKQVMKGIKKYVRDNPVLVDNHDGKYKPLYKLVPEFAARIDMAVLIKYRKTKGVTPPHIKDGTKVCRGYTNDDLPLINEVIEKYKKIREDKRRVKV